MGSELVVGALSGRLATLHYDLHSPLAADSSSSGKAPVLLIMGFCTDGAQWDDQVGFFTGRGHRVCTFDNRGIGRSSCPSGRYTTTLMAADVFELMAYLNWIPSGTHLAGISMGGMCADRTQTPVIHIMTPSPDHLTSAQTPLWQDRVRDDERPGRSQT
jgi:pimeloyl-ACP methyl ester carboxylesterase